MKSSSSSSRASERGIIDLTARNAVTRTRFSTARTLHQAAKEGNLELMKATIARRTRLDRLHEGRTPLWHAAENGHLNVVHHLVEKGADKDKGYEYKGNNYHGASPFYVAAQNGHLSVLQYLLEKGADKDKVTNDGRSPLYISVANGHVPVIQYLLEQGVDMDKKNDKGRTAVHRAAQSGRLPVLKLLLSFGARLKTKDFKGKRPIDFAASETIKRAIRYEQVRRRNQRGTDVVSASSSSSSSSSSSKKSVVDLTRESDEDVQPPYAYSSNSNSQRWEHEALDEADDLQYWTAVEASMTSNPQASALRKRSKGRSMRLSSSFNYTTRAVYPYASALRPTDAELPR